MYDYNENLNFLVDDIVVEYNKFVLNEDIFEPVSLHITKEIKELLFQSFHFQHTRSIVSRRIC